MVGRRTEKLTERFVGPYRIKKIVTNFIWPYLYQFFNDSHGLKGYEKPLKRPFNRC